jgi:hypothetical protein
MKVTKHILLGALVFAVVISITTYAATVRRICNAFCDDVRAHCNGGLLIGGSDGYPTGCTKSGVNCAGKCYRCNSGASDSFCARQTGSVCLIPTTGPFTVSCGKRVKYNCGGLWANRCTCPSAGGQLTSTNCAPAICYG